MIEPSRADELAGRFIVAWPAFQPRVDVETHLRRYKLKLSYKTATAAARAEGVSTTTIAVSVSKAERVFRRWVERELGHPLLSEEIIELPNALAVALGEEADIIKADGATAMRHHIAELQLEIDDLRSKLARLSILTERNAALVQAYRARFAAVRRLMAGDVEENKEPSR